MGALLRSRTLAATFDPRTNALNAVRLALATTVVIWHSFVVTGVTVDIRPIRQALEYLAVDGFFAISGYLIYSSWKRDPEWWRYLAARVLRIFPAFWICLVIIATVIAPVATAIDTGQSYMQVFSFDNVTYVLKNFALHISQFGIDGTPAGVPYPGVWDGSLWTLWWEFLCYLAVLGLGVLTLFRFRFTVPVLFFALLVAVIATSSGMVNNGFFGNAARFGMMFVAGMLVEQYAKRIPLSWPLLGLALTATAATMFLPDYRLVGALPWAFFVIGIGVITKIPALKLENDISYGMYIYAMPVQQVLAIFGLFALGVPLFALLSIVLTLPLAAASWFLVERNALKLRPQRRKDLSMQTEAVAS